MDALQRDQAPLSAPAWAALDEGVQSVARRLLVGRRFLPVFGPLGPGAEVLPVNQYHGWDMGRVNMVGADDEPVTQSARIYLRLPMLHKDFVMFWRDMEQASVFGVPQDIGAAQAAASFVAQAEDHLIFHGSESDGISGLLSVEGRHVLSAGDWEEPGSGFDDVSRAIAHLTEAGFYPPYAVAVGTRGYALWHRLYGNSGVLEIEQVAKLAQHGVYVSPLVPEGTALVLAVGAENVDLAIGMDLSVAYLESSQMNHHFRVLEILTPRIKRPQAIAVIKTVE